MDIGTVTEYVPAPGSAWRDGDAWLGGGTWLLSEPQPATRRLLDLTSFGWPPLTETDDGLDIAATCTLAELARWSPAPERAPLWRAATDLPRRCCDALLGSFKVHNAATVGGNICLSLPAGPMIALAAALDGVATIWPGPSGRGRARRLPVHELVTGSRANMLAPGELLRSVFLPARALRGPAALRQVSLSPLGRSAVLLIGVVDGGMADSGDSSPAVVLTLTAAVPRPVRLRVPLPAPPEAAARLDALVTATTGYLDDVHGSAPWRRAMTLRAVAEVTTELAAATGSPR